MKVVRLLPAFSAPAIIASVSLLVSGCASAPPGPRLPTFYSEESLRASGHKFHFIGESQGSGPLRAVENKVTRITPDVLAHGGSAFLIVRTGTQAVDHSGIGHIETRQVNVGTTSQSVGVYNRATGQYAGSTYSVPNTVSVPQYVPDAPNIVTEEFYKYYIVKFDD